jgi:hypothetical protein
MRSWFSNGILLVRPPLATYRLSGSEKQNPYPLKTPHIAKEKLRYFGEDPVEIGVGP